MAKIYTYKDYKITNLEELVESSKHICDGCYLQVDYDTVTGELLIAHNLEGSWTEYRNPKEVAKIGAYDHRVSEDTILAAFKRGIDEYIWLRSLDD